MVGSVRRRRGLGPGALVGAVSVAALLLFVVPSGPASAASPGSGANAAVATWEYGAIHAITFSGTPQKELQYSGNATYGYTVRVDIYASTTSANTFELVINRTVGASFGVKYCVPTCRLATDFSAFSAHVWEQVSSTSFLINDGVVFEAGTAVPAVALLNSSTTLTANESQRASSALPAASGVGTVDRASYLAAQVTGGVSVAFGTPFGLFPASLSASQSWNSSSAFAASGSAQWSSLWSHSGPLGSEHARSNGSLPVGASGTVNLTGSYSAANTIDLGGMNYSEVSLSIAGPFSLDDGFILLPQNADLFGGVSRPWSAGESGAASATMSFVDLSTGAAGPVGVGGSRLAFDSHSLEPSTSPSAGGEGPAYTGVADSAPTTFLQGEPQDAAQAQSTQTCLVGGSDCPSSPVAPGSLRGLFGLFGLGVVLSAVLIVAVVIAERRRLPPPAYPNAGLYPPGVDGRRRGPPEPAPSPPPTPDEDPLENLW
jgi:hypothetical protein